MISLRTALCLSGLLVIATGSAALDTPPETVNEPALESASQDLADEQIEAPRQLSSSSSRAVRPEAESARDDGEPTIDPTR